MRDYVDPINAKLEEGPRTALERESLPNNGTVVVQIANTIGNEDFIFLLVTNITMTKETAAHSLSPVFLQESSIHDIFLT
ncbi:hypothetical protein AS888_03105 [Peribacillus simplex]|uniref:Uncharacterized protein n=2 Tax=Peribacillus simplex TaxID=1478 RepID=A0A109MS85_9BACI|nr:hypothetical protein AS888_03105 [Peribacillus simplex]